MGSLWVTFWHTAMVKFSACIGGVRTLVHRLTTLPPPLDRAIEITFEELHIYWDVSVLLVQYLLTLHLFDLFNAFPTSRAFQLFTYLIYFTPVTPPIHFSFSSVSFNPFTERHSHLKYVSTFHLFHIFHAIITWYSNTFQFFISFHAISISNTFNFSFI